MEMDLQRFITKDMDGQELVLSHHSDDYDGRIYLGLEEADMLLTREQAYRLYCWLSHVVADPEVTAACECDAFCAGPIKPPVDTQSAEWMDAYLQGRASVLRDDTDSDENWMDQAREVEIRMWAHEQVNQHGNAVDPLGRADELFHYVTTGDLPD
jgi:hypothetical protein